MKKYLSVFLVICLIASFVYALPVQTMAAEETASEETTPDATTPDATTPDATTPDATTPEETTPEETTPDGDGAAGEGSNIWMDIFNKLCEQGLPAPVAAVLAAYDIFEAATVNFAKSIYRALDYIVSYFERML